MRGVRKLLLVAAAAALLAAGLVACGGGGGSSSSTTEAASSGQTGAGASGAVTQKAKQVKKGKSSPGEGRKKGSGGGEGGSGKKASEFVPEHHQDSGGGSKQFRVKGGDNSVQEFGKEAARPELDEAAVALHNFLDARAQGNWAAACQYMSNSVVESFEKLAAQAKQIENAGCAGILKALTNPGARQLMKAEAAKANVGSLRVEGDRSFVIYTGLKGTIMAMPMAQEGGAWKVGSLAGTPLK